MATGLEKVSFHSNTKECSDYRTIALISHAAASAAKPLQSCLTLCNPTDGSPPGFPVPGILQARSLEWVAISSSNAWKWKVKVKSLSHVWLLVTPWTAAHQALSQQTLSIPLPQCLHTWNKAHNPPQHASRRIPVTSWRVLTWPRERGMLKQNLIKWIGYTLRN